MSTTRSVSSLVYAEIDSLVEGLIATIAAFAVTVPVGTFNVEMSGVSGSVCEVPHTVTYPTGLALGTAVTLIESAPPAASEEGRLQLLLASTKVRC
jgi:hypothetical protein